MVIVTETKPQLQVVDFETFRFRWCNYIADPGFFEADTLLPVPDGEMDWSNGNLLEQGFLPSGARVASQSLVWELVDDNGRTFPVVWRAPEDLTSLDRSKVTALLQARRGHLRWMLDYLYRTIIRLDGVLPEPTA